MTLSTPTPHPPQVQDQQRASPPSLLRSSSHFSCSPNSGLVPAAVSVLAGHRLLLELEEISLGFPFPGLL